MKMTLPPTISTQVRLPPMWNRVVQESHNILSLHWNGFLSASSFVLYWLQPLPPHPHACVLYEWWRGATGFHWDLIKCEGPCGSCGLIERRFNRAAQGRLIHQPATNQRATGLLLAMMESQLTDWREAQQCLWTYVCTCTAHASVCSSNRLLYRIIRREDNLVSPCITPQNSKMDYVWKPWGGQN